MQLDFANPPSPNLVQLISASAQAATANARFEYEHNSIICANARQLTLVCQLRRLTPEKEKANPRKFRRSARIGQNWGSSLIGSPLAYLDAARFLVNPLPEGCLGFGSMETQNGPAVTLDEVIRRNYAAFGIGADKILITAELSERFADGVIAELPASCACDANAVRDRLLTLRKRGAAKGGLPRLERAFNGRKVNKPR